MYRFSILICCLIFLLAASIPGAAQTLSFTDITSLAGVAGPYQGGHGVMWTDVDGDGRPDAYVTMNWWDGTNMVPMPEYFFRNVNGTNFVEEAALRGIADFDDGSHGGVWGDLNNNGFYDLANGSFWRNRVYENDGTGFFTDRTLTSGFENVPEHTRGVVMFDSNGNGRLDVLCNNWWVTGTEYTQPNEFYRNDGNFTFTRIDNGLRNIVGNQGVTVGDYNNNGHMDVVFCSWSGPIQLYGNNGDGTFTYVYRPEFNVTSSTTQGVTFVDVNNDGWLDLHAQQGEGSSWLFINNKNGTFTQKSVPSGPGFMAGFEDLDNNGTWDMVYTGDNKVYLNDGAGNFTAAAGFSPGVIYDPRGIAFADIDGDGDLDFYYAQKRSYSRMIRNNLSGANTNWLRVQLTSPSGTAGAYGAKVKTYEAGQAGNPAAMISFREARSQEGYLGQNDPVLHFGLGGRTHVDVQVTFQGGVVMTRSNVEANQFIFIDASPPSAPVMKYIVPTTDVITAGDTYTKQLFLFKGGNPIPDWTIVQGPAGATISSNGRLTWTSDARDGDRTFTFQVRAQNTQGSHSRTWQVQVLQAPIAAFGFDSTLEGWTTDRWRANPALGWGTMQRLLTGNPGGGMRCTGYGSADDDKRESREGGEIWRVIPTTGYANITLSYDLRVSSSSQASQTLGTNWTGQGSDYPNWTVDHNLIDEQLTVFYSLDGGTNWIEAEWLKRDQLLASYTTYGTRTINLSSLNPAVADNADFALRFRWQFNTTSDQGDLDNIVVMGTIISDSISDIRDLPPGVSVALGGGQVLYMKRTGYGYIEEPDRSSGIRVEGVIPGNEGDLITLVGRIQETAGGEKYIDVTSMSTIGQDEIKPLGVNNRDLTAELMDGILVRAWGVVKAGSVTADSFIITDGSDDAGIRVITSGAPGVTEGDYVTVSGAAGFDGGRVIYRQ